MQKCIKLHCHASQWRLRLQNFKLNALVNQANGCKNHLSECTIHLSEIHKADATCVKSRNTQSSVGQLLQVFHLSDCHFYSSQTIGQVKFRTLRLHTSCCLDTNAGRFLCHNHTHRSMTSKSLMPTAPSCIDDS